ncbi:MAG: RNA-binding S4 domain-containing protein [Acidobacteriota bacterium]|nr:RNA-binding S4 domain-containing protein [Acidobacteriota bacterium]
MRLDLYLKASRLIARRSLAQGFCDAGLIKINGLTAKSSREVKPSDEIEIKRHNRLTRVRVSEVPDRKQVSKQDAANLYEILSEEAVAEELIN